MFLCYASDKGAALVDRQLYLPEEWAADHERRRVDAIAQSLPNLAWKRISAGTGSKGERLYEWTLIRGWEEDGWSHGLLVRRSIEEQPEHAYYWFYAPTRRAGLETLVRVAGQRWQIEQAFQAAKGECGLDHDEVRHWQGWYRHITLAMLAHAVPVILRARGEKTPGGQVPLSVPELRPLLTHLLWRGWHGVEHLLYWSQWRRKHRFHALRRHYRK